jgi:pantothenate synthetase
MEIIKEIKRMRDVVEEAKASGSVVGVVPTMSSCDTRVPIAT